VKNPALKTLSDKELLTQIQKLRRREHLSTIEILLHLNEVERRKLDLKLGYNALYDYCVKHLRYSSSGAGRRVAVARCVGRHPEVLDLLRSQKLNVTGVALVASVLNDGNKKKLLESIQNKSQAEIDAIAARYRTPMALRDRVKSVRVVVPEPKTAVRGGHAKAQPAAPGDACENNHYSHNGSGPALTGSKTTGNRSGNNTNMRTKQALLIQFLADKAFMKRYEEVRALLSQRLSDTSFENVFGALIEEFLERHSPTRRQARRDKKTKALRSVSEVRRDEKIAARGSASEARRDRKTKSARSTARPHEAAPKLPSRHIPAAALKESSPARTSHEARPKPRSRRIPAAVRDKVYARDKGRCTYVGRTGKRCGSMQALQIDHIEPFTRGGDNTPSNLRLLCAKHNRLAAQEVFGADAMKRFRRRE